ADRFFEAGADEKAIDRSHDGTIGRHRVAQPAAGLVVVSVLETRLQLPQLRSETIGLDALVEIRQQTGRLELVAQGIVDRYRLDHRSFYSDRVRVGHGRRLRRQPRCLFQVRVRPESDRSHAHRSAVAVGTGPAELALR